MHQGLHRRDYVPMRNANYSLARRLAVIVAAVGLSVAAGLSASAAPFGLMMGAKLSELRVVKRTSEELYEIIPPAPNSEFESYLARITPGEGLCKVIAIGKNHEGDTNGIDIRDAFADFETNLGEKYGDGRKFDYLKSGSIWKESGEWAMAVSRKERAYTKFWTRDQGSKLPGDVTAISLDVKATGPSTTYLALTYELANYDRCASHREASDKNAL